MEENIKEESIKEEQKKPKKSKTSAQIEALKEEIAQKDDLLKRTAAEFDNFKKRNERERASVAEFAKASLIKQLLPILDNIDRASSIEDKNGQDYIKGIELIVKQFEGLKDNIGIVIIGEVGEAFDPNLHEAVMHIEDESLGENVIAQVLQKGYKFGDIVLRPAMVQVAN